jgi:glycerol-3-phosphate acyltransferase PlsY
MALLLPAGAAVLFAYLVAFVAGSLPFSVWLGKLIARRDVRRFGSGNPGAMNAYRMGGPLLGVLVLLLDVSKAVLPVALAEKSLGLAGWELVPLGVLPVIGHVFSPFLRFHGGKGLAATLGVWIGLTMRPPVLALVVIVVVTLLVAPDVWGVLAGFAALLLSVALWMPSWPLATIAVIQAVVVIYRYRSQFAERARIRFAEKRP